MKWGVELQEGFINFLSGLNLRYYSDRNNDAAKKLNR